ncbi:MAG TPA: hypothetical protein VN025_13910 [Candidatus Dormibacteraeota bacterium]|nr:hypothetical protein [Candidatus Dormibacteraeota bacterium]
MAQWIQARRHLSAVHYQIALLIFGFFAVTGFLTYCYYAYIVPQ